LTVSADFPGLRSGGCLQNGSLMNEFLQRVPSGVLDVLVQEIATTLGASAVFVTAEVASSGQTLLAEFPKSIAASTGLRDFSAAEGAPDESSSADELVIAIPIHVRDKAVGWAVAAGLDVLRQEEAQKLVTLLANCAGILLGEPGAQHFRARPRWEDTARDGYWEWDFITGAMRLSRRSLALLDRRDTDRLAGPALWLARVHPDDKAALVTALLKATIDGGGPVECEHRIVKRDGSVLRVEARAVLEHDDVGRPQRLVGWLCDVTGRRSMESELRNADAMIDLGRMAAGAAHDFNNLLTVIRGHADIALGAARRDDVRESLELIRHAAAGASTLTRQLLSMRRCQGPERQAADVNEVVRAAERGLRVLAGNGVEVMVQLTPGRTRVHAEAAHIDRILLNLVVNGRDAMPRGGQLRITTGHVMFHATSDPECPLLLSPGSYVTLTVSDTGVGMDDVTRSSIFQPYFTTKPAGHGTGLGLWIVRDIVERFAGAIDVRTSVGQGTEFVIYFPDEGDGVEKPHRRDGELAVGALRIR
jgi:signal transduction histidine kinase